MLQWTLVCIYIFKLVFLFSLDKYPAVELLDDMVILFLNFLRNFHIVFHHVYANLCSYKQDNWVPFSPHPLQPYLPSLWWWHYNRNEVISYFLSDMHFSQELLLLQRLPSSLSTIGKCNSPSMSQIALTSLKQLWLVKKYTSVFSTRWLTILSGKKVVKSIWHNMDTFRNLFWNIFKEGSLCITKNQAGFPGGSVVKNPHANAGDAGGLGLIPGVRRIPWRRKWKPTPGFLPGKSHGQRTLASYSPWACKDLEMT